MSDEPELELDAEVARLAAASELDRIAELTAAQRKVCSFKFLIVVSTFFGSELCL